MILSSYASFPAMVTYRLRLTGTHFFTTLHSMKTVILLLLCMLAAAAPSAKDYGVSDLTISSIIHPEGTVRMTETRTFTFSGSFSWVEWNLEKEGFSELRDIEASVNGRSLSFSDTEEPGTFRVFEDRSKIAVRWFIDAEDESKEIEISYTLADAVFTDDPWSEFYWNFIGTGWEKPTQGITIDILFPEGADFRDLHGWSYAALAGERFVKDKNRITYHAQGIDAEQKLPLRFIFPAKLLSVPVRGEGEISPEAAEQDHREHIEKQEARRAFRAAAEPVSHAAGVLAALLSIIMSGWILYRFGRHEPSDDSVPVTGDHPPADLPPALAGWLLNRQHITVSHLSATILDLSLRDCFRIRQERQSSKGLFSKEKDMFLLELHDSPPDDLTAWEMSLFTFLKDRIEAGENTFNKLFPQSSRSRKWYREWSVMLSEHAKSFGWFISQPKVIAAQASVQGLFLLISIAVLIFSSNPLFGMLSLIASVLGIILCPFLSPRTARGQSTYQAWKAYADSLKQAQVSQDDAYMGAHIVYAVAFQTTGKKLDNLTKHIHVEQRHLPWIVFYPGMFSPSSVSNALTSMTAAAAASASSVAGGGAAGAGSAGGGSGGGAG